jgi:glycosyltransferase involved in cell wall biosynthesis
VTESGIPVSVIVPTRDSDRTLDVCLQSIRNQTYKNIEILVIDNFSTDNTRIIADKHKIMFFSKGPERSSQRNYGAQKSSGSYLMFIDSDMELTENVIEECVSKIVQEQSQAIVIPEISQGEGFWARCKALEKECYLGDETIEAARLFDKQVFFNSGGYDESIAGGGEDWDLALRIRKNGYKISRTSGLIIHHEGNLSLLMSLRKKFYYAQTISNYLRKHPEMASRQLTPIRPAFIKNWRRLTRNPIIACGMLFMKTFEFGAGFVGYIAGRSV